MSLRSPVLLTALALLLPGCPGPAEEPPPEGNGGDSGPAWPEWQEVLQIEFSPEVALPGETLAVRVTGPDLDGGAAVLELDGAIWSFELEGSGATEAEFEIVAPTAEGDYLASATGATQEVSLAGYETLTVRSAGPCPEGQVPERGACVESSEGSPFSPTLRAAVNVPTDLIPGEGGGRSMMHPQSFVRLSDELILGCFSDAIGILDTADFTEMDVVQPPPDGPPQRVPIVETVLQDVGLESCQAIVWDPARDLAILASRGEAGRPGGLSSWQVPDPAEELFAPVLLDVLEDSEGFEDILFAEGMLFSSRNPRSLSVVGIGGGGELNILLTETLDLMGSAWALAAEPGRLFLGDGGGLGVDEERHEDDWGEDHAPEGGHVFVFDITDPLAPQLEGWVGTPGPVKGLTLLGDHVLAAGGGSSGIELIDYSDPSQPTLLQTIETPGVAKSLDAADGYLLLADWSTVRLYDVADPRAPRFLGASNLTRPGSHFPGLIAAQFALLDGSRFWIGEFNNVVVGDLLPGRSGPRLDLFRNPISGPRPAEGEDALVRIPFDNGGRQALELRVPAADGSQTPGSGAIQRVIPPGESGQLLVSRSVPSSEDSLEILIESSGVIEGNRSVAAVLHEEHYGPGDPTDPFRLPVTNLCDDSGCSTDTSCFDSRDSSERGVPLLIAFFSSW